MPVNLQMTPTSNTTGVRVAFINNGAILASLDPGNAAVLTITYDQIGLFNPGYMPIIRTQNPNVAHVVVPGEVAYVSNGGGGTLLQHAPPHGVQQTVLYT
jgi:hypothetical protein